MKAAKSLWMLAAILICGTTTFTSCTNEDNPADPAANLSERIIGKWVDADINGKPALTNEKTVMTFLSATKAINSQSRVSFTPAVPKWNNKLEFDVQISGNKVTLTGHPNDSVTLVKEYIITAINDSEILSHYKHTTFRKGEAINKPEQDVRLTKVTVDYREAVLGLWECTGLTGGETFNDANARLEFLDDGTYRYYRQDDAGQWQAVTTREFQDYFVDGTLLATRWKNNGEDELREWWEIESLSGNEMVWTALRQNPDDSTFQQIMTWKKIDL